MTKTEALKQAMEQIINRSLRRYNKGELFSPLLTTIDILKLCRESGLMFTGGKQDARNGWVEQVITGEIDV